MFCPECGKELGGVTPKKRPHPSGKRPQSPANGRLSSERTDDPMDMGYDGYYDDVLPVDAGEDRDRADPELVKRVVLVILGALGAIGLASALMIVL